MARGIKALLGLLLFVSLGNSFAAASGSFICAEPGGKRLVYINGKEVSKDPNSKMLLYIDGNDILVGDIHAKATLVVDEHDIRPSPTGVKIATFDGANLRHGPYSDGKVFAHYKHPSISPDFRSDRIYSIEGDPLTKQQLVAGLYVLRPEWFKLTDAEIAEQVADMKKAAAEEEARAAADQLAGKWMVLSGYGAVEKTGRGSIVIDKKRAGAYPITFDYTKNGGPSWAGVAVYKELFGDKLFWVAYGTPKTVGLCVYEIKGGTLDGKWYPWYIDGDAKNVGSEVLKGPETLDGDYNIESAKAPTTGAAYAGTVTIKPLPIVGASDVAKPYSVTWTIGGAKINGIGIRHRNFLFVSSGTGADVNIGGFKIDNGNFTGDWFKLGSKEMGGGGATKMD